MISFPIKKDNSAFQKAIEEKDIGKITGYVKILFDKYSDTNIAEYKKNLETKDEKKEYEQEIVNYESLVSKGCQFSTIMLRKTSIILLVLPLLTKNYF